MTETTTASATSVLKDLAVPSLIPGERGWQRQLPRLEGSCASLRELEAGDGAHLLPLLSAPEVTRFLSPPPESPERFADFVASTARERAAGRYAGFAILPHDHTTAVGIVQLRQLEPGFRVAEWGVALGSAYWGRGLFRDAAELALAFAFDHLGVHRLEARVAAQNARGNAAVEKLGGVAEGLLRQSLLTVDGTRVDQVLWAWLADDWRAVQRRRSERLAWVH